MPAVSKAQAVGKDQIPSAQDDPSRTTLQLADPLTRFLALLSSRPEIPETSKQALDGWIRQLLQKTGTEAASKPAPSTQRAEQARVSSSPSPAPAQSQRSQTIHSLDALRLGSTLSAHKGSAPELPDTWEAWVRSTTRALTDPKVSPKEASFHALQAKEQTAFFEIPLPWAPQAPLQLWVESDEEGSKRNRPSETKRVLMGMNFSRLGETRVGLERNASSLQVRIWTEHPEILEKEAQHLKDELEGLDRRVDLKVLTLNPGPDGSIPTLRAVVAGPALHAIG
jgi:hypothetical protein